jgi:hypothetical protein
MRCTRSRQSQQVRGAQLHAEVLQGCFLYSIIAALSLPQEEEAAKKAAEEAAKKSNAEAREQRKKDRQAARKLEQRLRAICLPGVSLTQCGLCGAGRGDCYVRALEEGRHACSHVNAGVQQQPDDSRTPGKQTCHGCRVVATARQSEAASAFVPSARPSHPAALLSDSGHAVLLTMHTMPGQSSACAPCLCWARSPAPLRAR